MTEQEQQAGEQPVGCVQQETSVEVEEKQPTAELPAEETQQEQPVSEQPAESVQQETSVEVEEQKEGETNKELSLEQQN